MSNDERRRQRAERVRKRKRRRNLILTLILTLLIFIVGIVLCLTVFFHVSAVTVTGDELYSSQEVIEASGITIGENMFLMNAKKVAKSIEQTLPYVESVQVKRSPSGEIKLVLTAAKAGAALEREGSFLLLSDKGKLLEENVTSLNDGVVLISGVEIKNAVVGTPVEFAAEDTLETFKQCFDILQKAELTGITELDLSDRTNIKAVYAGRITLKLGMLQDMEEKMDFVKATLARNEETAPEFRGEIDFTIAKKAFLHPETEANPQNTEPTAPAA